MSWPEMKESEYRYIPSHYKQDLSERVASLTQGKSTIADYSNEFHTLSSRADLSEPKHMTVGRYKREFQKQIRDIIRLSNIATMAEAYHASLNVEALLHNSVTPLRPMTNQASAIVTEDQATTITTLR